MSWLGGACAIAVALAGCGGAEVAATVQTTAAHAAAQTRPRPAQTVSSPGVVPVVTVQLYGPLAQYTQYVEAKLARLRPQLAALRAAAASGNLGAAESDWLAAHSTWLELGQDDDAYGAFGDLGERIDGEANGLRGTTSNPSFTGFHRVEMDLWERHDLTAAAGDARELAALAGQLTAARVQRDLPSSATALDAWVLRCHEILEDALRDSLSQDDDYGSNSDLVSLRADVSATREMLKLLAPLIEQRQPAIVPSATRELAAIDGAINAAGGARAGRSLARLPLRRRQALDETTGAALETLAPVSELMQISVPGT
ncbi:MAG TPA: EfeM/EfeO family lipoprotein [Solirubrobacteraceae bacterium]|nr:EfeM/EfeO family lipoprotein [Solirubrobacteraceae bacterium]